MLYSTLVFKMNYISVLAQMKMAFHAPSRAFLIKEFDYGFCLVRRLPTKYLISAFGDKPPINWRYHLAR
ncbi:MAG: hypothetical protein CL578_16835 [Alteromonadaceae bacterium]|nr:hypothetical protein [Alteromonadaceae bacterium]